MMGDLSGPSPDDALARLSGSLSRARRIGAVVALVAGLAGLVFVGLLWATEPGELPGRTRVAFGGLMALCLVWSGYGGWALTRRVPMFALDRVVAAWIALAASVLTTAGLVAVVPRQGVAAIVGAVLIGVSVVLAVRAHLRRAALLRRKRELS
ncbi:hypothetical protein [Nonomuraea sp. NPDC049158]|uniref:hypothetical protein n=1 Tax=Nonomuraea sp. NPDC049158 TaxID=3155649 RepID=UPI00340867C0